MACRPYRWHRRDPDTPVADMTKSVEFWEAAGFDVNPYDDGFAVVSFDEQSVFDLDLVEGFDPAANCAGLLDRHHRPD